MSFDYKKEYQRYLASPEWKALRAKARERAGNKCELCSGPPDHVHHVKYPKKYQDDHIDNLVVACEACHKKLHGIRNDITYGEWLCVATGVIFDGGRAVPRLRLNFSVLPEEDWNVETFSDVNRPFREQRAVEVRDQLGGFAPDSYVNFTAFLSLKNILLEDLNTSVEEMLMAILSRRNYAEIYSLDSQETAALFLDYFSPGQVTIAFKKP